MNFQLIDIKAHVHPTLDIFAVGLICFSQLNQMMQKLIKFLNDTEMCPQELWRFLTSATWLNNQGAILRRPKLLFY